MQSKAIESTDETQAIFDVVVDYTYALDTLDNYDYERLMLKETTPEVRFHATYENAMQTINALREKFGGSTLFGNEKDDSFKSSIGQIYQTFGGEDLYPSVEEKAAMLLYLVTWRERHRRVRVALERQPRRRGRPFARRLRI